MTKRRQGYTLMEVMISMMLASILAGAVFTLAISAQQSSNKVDRRVLANQYTRHLSEELAQFVTADRGNGLIAGPGRTFPGTASWFINGTTGLDGRTVTDTVQGNSDLCTSNCYALANGTHNLSGFLPSWFESPPFNATISYYVAPQGSGSTEVDYCRDSCAANIVDKSTITMVSPRIDWTEP
jgi:prepilin-type N-terminal cleavage/methylation domain-containing protein